MSILDRVTRAVGDAVDRGKKEVDQFVQIQKINGQISDLEKSITQSNGQIQQTKLKIGDVAIEMLRAGTIASPEMKVLLDQITGIEQQISSVESEIKQKRAEIEAIKSEDKAPKAPDPAVEVPPAPPAPSVPPVQMDAKPASRFCPQCGAPSASGGFCPQCGTKLA
jgi:prefoldin subunit 5